MNEQKDFNPEEVPPYENEDLNEHTESDKVSLEKNYKKLFRASDNSLLLGVCGGLGYYFRIDPVLFRLGFILISFFSSWTFIIYLILAASIPAGKIELNYYENYDINKSLMRELSGLFLITFAILNFFRFPLFNNFLFITNQDLQNSATFIFAGLFLLSKTDFFDNYKNEYPKKLFVFNSDKKFFGVAIALSKYLGMNVLNIRAFLIISVFLTLGLSLIFYIFAYIFLSRRRIELND